MHKLCIVGLCNKLRDAQYIRQNSGVMLFSGTRGFWCRMFNKEVANTEFEVITKEGLLKTLSQHLKEEL